MTSQKCLENYLLVLKKKGRKISSLQRKTQISHSSKGMWETPLLTGRRLFSLQTRCYVLVHIKPCTPSPLWNRAVAAAGIQRLVKVEGNPGEPSDWVSEGTKNYYSAKATQLCRNGLKTTRGMFSIKSKRVVHTWSPSKTGVHTCEVNASIVEKCGYTGKGWIFLQPVTLHDKCYFKWN